MKPDDLVRVRHMVEAAESALRFIAGRQREDLDGHEMLRFALVRAVEIIGEAASREAAPGQDPADIGAARAPRRSRAPP